MQYATVQFYVDGPSDPATGPPTLGRSDRSSYRLTKRSFIRTAPCVLKSVFCSIAPRTPHSALPISHPRPRRNFSSRHLLPRCVNTVDHTIPVTSPLPGALRLSHKCGTTFLRVINGMTGNPSPVAPLLPANRSESHLRPEDFSTAIEGTSQHMSATNSFRICATPVAPVRRVQQRVPEWAARHRGTVLPGQLKVERRHLGIILRAIAFVEGSPAHPIRRFLVAQNHFGVAP